MGDPNTLLPDGTHIGYVHLRVNNLDRVLTFYQELLGFAVVFRTEAEVGLSATGRLPLLLLLTEDKSAPRRGRRSPGLFHLAIRFPERKELAKTLLRLIRAGYPLQGASDHAVSEALYLADPDGNGVELYSDRPRDTWEWQAGEIVMVTEPLDIQDLLASARGEVSDGIHPDTDIGHIHLSVSSLEKANAFYVRQLGFGLTTGSYPGALFMAAGSYHHHIGANIWMTKDGMPSPGNSAGLAAFGIAVPPRYWSKYPSMFTRANIPFKEAVLSSGQPVFKLHDFDGLGVEIVADVE